MVATNVACWTQNSARTAFAVARAAWRARPSARWTAGPTPARVRCDELRVSGGKPCH